MTVNEIYNCIGQNILNCIQVEEIWDKAELNIEAYVNKYVEFNGNYFSGGKIEKELDVENFNHREMRNAVYELLKIMTEDTDKNKWNKAKFTVHADNKFDMEFTWDQVLDDEMKKYN